MGCSCPRWIHWILKDLGRSYKGHIPHLYFLVVSVPNVFTIRISIVIVHNLRYVGCNGLQSIHTTSANNAGAVTSARVSGD